MSLGPMVLRQASLALVLAAGVACSSSSSPTTQHDSGAADTATGSGDAGPSGDTGASGDAGDAGDAASSDSGKAGDTWYSYAQGFFSTYCVECHNARDPQSRDYTAKADVVRDKDVIRCGTSAVQEPSWSCAAFPPPKQFPITDDAGTNSKPTDAERTRLVAWIDAGCP